MITGAGSYFKFIIIFHIKQLIILPFLFKFQLFVISIMYESADLKRCFGYPIVFVSMKTKTQLDYEAIFKALNRINLFYNDEIFQTLPIKL